MNELTDQNKGDIDRMKEDATDAVGGFNFKITYEWWNPKKKDREFNCKTASCDNKFDDTAIKSPREKLETPWGTFKSW